MVYKKTFILILILLLSGCSSFGEGLGRGITSAILNNKSNNEVEDNRTCRIWSKGFRGIGQSIEQTKGKTKVLMVHGVGEHTPGYSTMLLENLAAQLDLTVFVKPQKNMTITSDENSNKDLGNLRLTKLTSRDGNRELLFYELTWSSISKPEKEVLTFDQSGLVSFRRTDINHMLKKAANDAMADPLVYLGNKQNDIQTSVAQSYCWMIKSTFSDFPDNKHIPCTLKDDKALERAKKDDYFFISHSLGSRITIDAFQRIARLLNKDEWKQKYPKLSELHNIIQNREITIFMLSNQLQLMQLGRPLPEIAGQIPTYCTSKGAGFEQRFADKTNIIALSDPNDVLSYSIPQRYSEKYLDSRMCPEITNININVAKIIDLFGITEVANPIEAHTSYNEDMRVVSLLAYGLGENTTSPIIKERCSWIKTVN